eukprot:699919-Amphidinium_carterae.1
MPRCSLQAIWERTSPYADCGGAGELNLGKCFAFGNVPVAGQLYCCASRTVALRVRAWLRSTLALQSWQRQRQRQVKWQQAVGGIAKLPDVWIQRCDMLRST